MYSCLLCWTETASDGRVGLGSCRSITMVENHSKVKDLVDGVCYRCVHHRSLRSASCIGHNVYAPVTLRRCRTRSNRGSSKTLARAVSADLPRGGDTCAEEFSAEPRVNRVRRRLRSSGGWWRCRRGQTPQRTLKPHYFALCVQRSDDSALPGRRVATRKSVRMSRGTTPGGMRSEGQWRTAAGQDIPWNSIPRRAIFRLLQPTPSLNASSLKATP